MIWINGPFGVGKTTVARELSLRVARGVIIDPEKIGFILQRITRCKDFRSLASWEWLTIRLAQLTERLGFSPVIPMTISNIEQMQRLRRQLFGDSGYGPVVQLVAPREVILFRIMNRPHGAEWAVAHLDEGQNMQRYPVFGFKIEAGSASPQEIAESIITQVTNALR